MIRGGGSWGGRRRVWARRSLRKGQRQARRVVDSRRLAAGGRAAVTRKRGLDLNGLPIIERVDSAGRYLLALMRRYGAQLRATGAEMTELVRTLAGDWPLTEE
jgi:hypothetical protein